MARRTVHRRAAAPDPRSAAPAVPVMPEYSDLLAKLPAVVYVADTGDLGRWHYVSPKIDQILGFAPGEWLADPTLWARRLHPDDRERVISTEASHSAGDGHPGPS